jgi:hypothetical protein
MAFSLSDIITQNTLGQSEGFPEGVPSSWNWYTGWNDDGQKTPSADFTAVEGWGAVYQKEGAPAYSNPNANIEVANAKTYVHLIQTGEWVLVQDQLSTQLAGGHFVTDFAGNAGYEMQVTPLAGAGTAFDCPPAGYNDHFWYGARGTYAAGTVDAVYVQMDMRVTDPNLNLVAMVGADWWRDADAPYLDDHSTNPGVGSSNWVELSTEWRTLGYYSPSTTQFQADLPPPLLGSAQTDLPPPPVVGSTDTVAPPAPETAAPDTDTAGDPGSVTSPPVSGANLLVNGSFETSLVAANRWAGFSSIPGWTALTGGTIELWNNLNNVQATDGMNFGELDYLGARDGLYQTVKTSAGQSYDLSFDARSRPGFTSTTTTMEVLWNESVVATVPPLSAWNTYNFAVTGTGGQDRLTFREAAGQSADGLGALYDNVSLVPVGSGSVSSVQQSAVSDTSQAMNLVTQYSAVCFPQPSVSPVGGLHHTDMSAALGHTLARSHKFA